MVNYLSNQLDYTFAALADPTRRAILVHLMQGETSVNELAQPFDMSLPGITKHLRVLERAGLLSHEKRGRVRVCRLEPEPLKDAVDWLSVYAQFWDDQFSALADYFNENSEEGVGHEDTSGKNTGDGDTL